MKDMKIPKNVNPFTEPKKVVDNAMVGVHGILTDIDELNTQEAEIDKRSKENIRMYGGINNDWTVPTDERDWRSMYALVDIKGYKHGKPAKDCVKIFTDIKSKKLREVIYKELEKVADE